MNFAKYTWNSFQHYDFILQLGADTFPNLRLASLSEDKRDKAASRGLLRVLGEHDL